MRRLILLALALAAVALAPGSAQADFGVNEFDLSFSGEDGITPMQAGSHPGGVLNKIELNTVEDPLLGEVADGAVRDIEVKLPKGLVGDPGAIPRCANTDFINFNQETKIPKCSDSSAVGVILLRVLFHPKEAPSFISPPVYNLIPPPGVVQKLGFIAAGVPVTIEFTVSQSPPYEVIATLHYITQVIPFMGSKLTVWGNPASPVHDSERGGCLNWAPTPVDVAHTTGKACPSNIAQAPFITLPRACKGPLSPAYAADSWQSPGPLLLDGSPDLSDPRWSSGEVLTHDDAEPPNPQGMTGCSKLGFNPSIAAAPTAKAASSPTGLDFSLDVHDEGLTNPSGIANSDIEKTEVTLPEGFTINPSIAEGLAVCSEADLERETSSSEAGAGCPDASKIGTVEVETPLLEENVDGSLYQATPYENPFHSLVALYIVIKNPKLGIKVVQPLKVIPDPVTGRLTTVAEEMPQLPFSHFKLHFREGTRSPLATPPACGTYNVEATLYPYSGAPAVHTSSAFEVISGPESKPCPKGGLPPFHPELLAGTLNNAAGRFSPFNVKITRTDSEQEITHFSIKLPPGVAGKLAGIPFCTDAQIAQAQSRTGPHGGGEELAKPSCPAASRVGRTLVGSGVGPSLAYAPGKVYLAGPYHGAPISFVSITSGVVGPFDIGTVVVRLAIKVNPETGEVFLDSTGSDPIPHIIEGIPIHLRDIRAYTDRPEFTFNPTSCERKQTAATVLGSGLDFASEADDNPFVSTSPFQAADCAALPFKPKLSLRLIGGTKRGDYPRLKAFLRMKGFGEAGVARARVTLPRSEFIANAHFDTICTRVQFKLAGGNGEACPAGSIYGWARAKTPVLEAPLEGPIFLRSSEHELPDVVASLRGQEIDVHLVGHVDSVKGQLRNTFETVPDAPVEWASFSFKGQKKGLFENSTNLCVGKHKAKAEFTGQTGKLDDYRTALKVKCGGKAKKKTKSQKKARR
jgi:hypothetical protein